MNGATAPAGPLLLALSLAAGCGPAAAGPRPLTPAPAPAVAAPEAPVGLPPLTEDERATATRLGETVRHLAGDVRERNASHAFAYATAIDDAVIALEKLGYEVRRQGFSAGEDVFMNVEARLPGGEHGREVIAVTAHLDSAPGSPGADAASAVAAVLELARRLAGKRPGRSVRLVLLANGEAPLACTPAAGSLAYAKDLASSGLRVLGIIALDGIAVFRGEPGTARLPPEVAPGFPSTADFVAVLGDAASPELARTVGAALARASTIPVKEGAVPPAFLDAVAADAWGFRGAGIPVAAITDTGPFRSAEVRHATDTPDRLDLERLSRVVVGLGRVVADLATAPDGAARP